MEGRHLCQNVRVSRYKTREGVSSAPCVRAGARGAGSGCVRLGE